MKKKILSMALAILLVAQCTSCSSMGTADEEPFVSEIDFNEDPITITYMTIGDKPTNGQTEEVIASLNRILEKKINAKLDIYYIGWNDYLNNYNNTLSDGSVDIDLVGTGADWLDTWLNAKKGYYLPLSEEMLEKYCPKTYHDVTSYQWDKCRYNGTIYCIPENGYTQWTNHGFIYRGDIADKCGVGEIDNWSELTRYMRYVAVNYPEMIPWDADGTNTIITLGYLTSVLKYVPIYEVGTYGLWGAYASDMSTIASPYYEGDDFIRFAELMKEWNNIGVWRNDLGNAQDNREEFFAGISAVEQQHTEQFYKEIKPAMEINQPDSDVRFFWFGKESGNISRTSILHGAMAVYSGSKNPERALMVYELLRNDPECYRLIRYGIEGRQYSLDNSGMIDKPSGYNYDRDNFVVNFWWGRRDSLELPDVGYAWEDYYNLLDVYEHVAIDYPWDGIQFIDDDTADELQDVLAVCDKYIPEITYARYDVSPEEEVAAFRAALKEAGFEKVTNKFQAILDSH